MAELEAPELRFEGTCPDCGERRIELPPPLPDVGDDFDWLTRDYDGFRLTMLQELAARFPERTRWTPADMEVVLVEVLATVLDQLSDMLDRVAAEAYLETARRPESVRRLLDLIGYDAVQLALARGRISPAAVESGETTAERLEGFWLRNPHFMEEARREGPRSIHEQHRMVTVDDHARRLEEHPLVLRAHARSGWTGSWETVRVAVVAWGNRHLDGEEVTTPEGETTRRPRPYPSEVRELIEELHREQGLPLPPLDGSPPPSIRAVLRPYLEAYRMVGQEVVLENAVPVPVTFSVSLRVAGNFYRSEVRHAVHQALGTGPGGFFEPGRLAFGEDLHAGDLIQTLMGLGGVESACLDRFKRLGSQFADQTASGVLELEGLELAVCDNDPAKPERGYYRVTLHGGLKG
ncbi:MAG: hypothetical protein PVG07_05905 [Acidobacteriota bacterium]|jgi:hypothetical protein